MLERLQEFWDNAKDRSCFEKLYNSEFRDIKFRYCSCCDKVVYANMRLSQNKRCNHCGKNWFIRFVYCETPEITTLEDFNRRFTFEYDNGSTNMGEFSWGVHYESLTKDFTTGRIGEHHDKSGNYTVDKINRLPKLPFNKGIVAYRQWWYLWNENKASNIYICKLNIS